MVRNSCNLFDPTRLGSSRKIGIDFPFSFADYLPLYKWPFRNRLLLSYIFIVNNENLLRTTYYHNQITDNCHTQRATRRPIGNKILFYRVTTQMIEIKYKDNKIKVIHNFS